ncbi:putative beta-3 adrenergic receptor-like [Apostichopus japonicus]|uniref:Putative beta-3 adrenergic receptor-like n=1 Tax=Stichopus japonicus TaxID=307972 RepID=A0A2G8KEF4_STIJA|nr:putative beta-3 adrenergic receptor-like [Apostichopus japonicus]
MAKLSETTTNILLITDDFSDFEDVFIGILQVLNGVLIVLGNTINLCVIPRLAFHKNMRCYLLSLAIADMTTGLMILTCLVSLHFKLLSTDNSLCKLTGFLFSLAPAVSSYSLVWIAIDKFCLIQYPFKYDRLFKEFVPPLFLSINLLCTIPLISWISYGNGQLFTNIIYQPHFKICLVDFTNPEKAAAIFIAGFFGMGIPLVITSCLYLKLSMTAHEQARRINNMIFTVNHAHGDNSSQQAANPWRGVIFSFIVIGAFFFAWSPFWITQIIHLSSDNRVSRNLDFLFGYLTISNSWWNVVIYTFGSKDFRKEVKKLFLLQR